MSGYYIDTSVLGAYYCPEALSDRAEAILTILDEPVISTLSEIEFTSLLAKKVRLRELTKARAQAVLLRFHSHIEGRFYRKLALDTFHYIKASDWLASFKTALHTLDALHLALANIEELTLITADKGMLKAARRFSIAVRDW